MYNEINEIVINNINANNTTNTNGNLKSAYNYKFLSINYSSANFIDYSIPANSFYCKTIYLDKCLIITNIGMLQFIGNLKM
jgi:hypothetical protein